MVEILAAHSEEHYRLVRELLAEYTAWDIELTRGLGISSQSLLDHLYAQGSAEIPGDYVPPSGYLALALDGDVAAGCGAFRRLGPGECELKRMYVRDAFRGQGLGRRLALALIHEARQAGHRTMRLETATFMTAAADLYRSLGFRETEAYHVVPEPFAAITLFMELNLHGPGAVADGLP